MAAQQKRPTAGAKNNDKILLRLECLFFPIGQDMPRPPPLGFPYYLMQKYHVPKLARLRLANIHINTVYLVYSMNGISSEPYWCLVSVCLHSNFLNALPEKPIDAVATESDDEWIQYFAVDEMCNRAKSL